MNKLICICSCLFFISCGQPQDNPESIEREIASDVQNHDVSVDGEIVTLSGYLGSDGNCSAIRTRDGEEVSYELNLENDGGLPAERRFVGGDYIQLVGNMANNHECPNSDRHMIVRRIDRIEAPDDFANPWLPPPRIDSHYISGFWSESRPNCNENGFAYVMRTIPGPWLVRAQVNGAEREGFLRGPNDPAFVFEDLDLILRVQRNEDDSLTMFAPVGRSVTIGCSQINASGTVFRKYAEYRPGSDIARIPTD